MGENYALKLLVDFGVKVIKDLRYACHAKALHKLADLVLTLMDLWSKFFWIAAGLSHPAFASCLGDTKHVQNSYCASSSS